MAWIAEQYVCKDNSKLSQHIGIHIGGIELVIRNRVSQ
jgi:hypothetical protein